MKASVLLFPLLFSLSLQAQTPFAPVGAQWTYDQEDGIYTMTVVGDTTLLGHSCSIIAGSTPSICWQSHAYTYQSGDTVFWSDDAYLPQFFELYRWNATVGESWNVWENGPVIVTYTVFNTGTTTVNGQVLRTLNVAAIDPQGQWAQTSGVLIETIGDTLFMFPWLAAFCDAIVPWPLRCYSDSDLGVFMRPGVGDCAGTTGVAEEDLPRATYWYPSPVEAGEPFTITLRQGSSTAHLRILDVSGRTVFDRAINGSATFSLSQAGMYLVQILGTGPHIPPQRLIVR